MVDPSHRDQLFKHLEKKLRSSYQMTLDHFFYFFLGGHLEIGGYCFLLLFVFSTLNFQHDILENCGYSGACSKNQIFATSGIKKKFDAIFTPRVAGKSSQRSKFL